MVASDTVAWLNEDGSRTIYAAPKGTAHSNNNSTIRSTYKQAGTIPLNSSGSVADYWVGDVGIDEETGSWHPSTQGSGSAQGCADMYYAGGTVANAFREYLQCGGLGDGSNAGSCYLNLRNRLGNGNWNYLAGYCFDFFKTMHCVVRRAGRRSRMAPWQMPKISQKG